MEAHFLALLMVVSKEVEAAEAAEAAGAARKEYIVIVQCHQDSFSSCALLLLLFRKEKQN